MLRPLGDRVLVKIDDSPQLSPGGIVLPDSAQEKPQRGIVVRVGEGRTLDDGSRAPMEVKEGDCVIFSKYGGSEVKDGDEELTLLREDDIYAIDTGPASAAKKSAPAAKKKTPAKKTKKKK